MCDGEPWYCDEAVKTWTCVFPEMVHVFWITNRVESGTTMWCSLLPQLLRVVAKERPTICYYNVVISPKYLLNFVQLCLKVVACFGKVATWCWLFQTHSLDHNWLAHVSSTIYGDFISTLFCNTAMVHFCLLKALASMACWIWLS